MNKSSLKLVSEIGTLLSQQTHPKKDFIVKSLRKAADALSNLEQSPEPRTAKQVQAIKKREDALKPLTDAVVCGGLLHHDDKDVKLLVAICVTELFRVKAPKPPFEDTHLRDVFKLIIGLFADLADTASPLFSKRVKVLDTVAQLKCCILMLEIDCTDLVLEMFNVFFSVVRNDHHDILFDAMSSMMRDILNESEDASQKLLEVILRNLIKRKKDTTCASYKLAELVIRTCAQEDVLYSLVCKFLSSCIYARDAVGCGIKEYYHEIIFEVFQCAPHMLLAVIPILVEELSADQVDVRLKSVNLVGRLFALPNHHVALKFHNLFVEFVERFCDTSVDVRISALLCAKDFYAANPSGRESLKIITSVEERLLDFDDRVRMQAVTTACDICSSNLMHAPPKLITEATERLWDKKITVRKWALQKLMETYQNYCKKCFYSSMSTCDHFEEIPCKILMLCYEKKFRSQIMELFLADNLFPDDLSVKERTNHWIHMFSLFKSHHEKALNTILIQKRRLQNEMKNYLAIRKKSKEICAEETQKKIKSVITKVSASFSDSHKAEECLHMLNQIKDNNLFKSLEKLLEKSTFTNGQTIKDELLVMIGDKNADYEFFRSLFSKCLSNIFSSDHIQCILDYLSNDKDEDKNSKDSSGNLSNDKDEDKNLNESSGNLSNDKDEDKNLIESSGNLSNDKDEDKNLKDSSGNLSNDKDDDKNLKDSSGNLSNDKDKDKKLKVSSGNLLLAIVRIFPSMLKGLEKHFQMLLELTSPVNDMLIEVVAMAGPNIFFNLSGIYPFVERTCFSGTRRQAKFAVSAIVYTCSEHSDVLKLFERLVYSLNSQWNVSTIMQNQRYPAQCSVSAFETQVEEIKSYICHKIRQMESLDDDDLTSLYGTSQSSESRQSKEWNVPTILQSLGCITQCSVSDLGSQVEEFTSYICRKIIEMECLEDDDRTLHDTSQCSKSCQLKIYGLKTLVKSFLPYRRDQTKQNINGLLDMLSRMLRESDVFVNSENDKAHIRLAAATAILRIAKKWDLHITPDIFRFTILIAKDSSPFVRSKFLSKTQKLLKERKLPIRFACAFAFQNGKHMAEFIKDYSIAACKRQPSVQFDYPAYILVYLIHVLARNNDFPEALQNEKVYADICSPLFLLLQALIDISIVDGDQELVNDAVLYIFDIFQAIRRLDDSVDSHATIKLHKLAEIGIFILKALYPREISVSQARRQILLPSSLYKARLTKDDANSKCPECFFDKSFLSRVFDMLKTSVTSQKNAQKLPAKTGPKPARKGQQDIPRPKTNICSRLDLTSSKPDSFPRRDIIDANTVDPNICSKKRRKHVPSSDSGSIGLHECSTIVKQQKLPSKQIENTSERNRLSSSDFVSCKGSLVESRVLTRKSKRAATCSLENAVTSTNLTDSGSIGLHECSTIVKQQKLPSKQIENTSERNRLSSSDSVSCKGSLVESRVLTRKSKRAATCSLENAVTSTNHTVQHFKCPRTNLKDSCGSKTRDILADVSNKKLMSHCDPSEHSSLSSIKKTSDTAGCLAAKDGTSLCVKNLGAASVKGSEKCTETITSEVVNTNLKDVRRTRRKL